jgi:protein required for attachment to host cells
MRLPKNALVVVADGERYLMLEADPDRGPGALAVRRSVERAVQRNADMGTERPGRYPAPGGRREAVEQADWKRLDKAAFASGLAAELEAEATRPLVLIADPRTLGTLRASLSDTTARRVTREIAADMTHHTVDAISELLAGA